MSVFDGSADVTPETARQQLYEVMETDWDLQEKADRALELGTAYLDVENGHLTYIEPVLGHWEAIASTDDADGAFPPGLSLDLSTTYCRRTIDNESSIALHDVPNQGWEDDPAFEQHDLHCYLGVPVTVDDTTYGTVCFVSHDPRTQPFSSDETMFAELVGHLLGRAIERTLQRTELQDRQQLVNVLDRVLRHNLRNDLAVVKAHAEHIQHSTADTETADAQTITETVDDLLELGESARQLTDLTSGSDTAFARDLDLEVASQRIAAQIEDDYPAASITVESPSQTELQTSSVLEIALSELIENAAKHSGENPSVTVALTHTEEAVKIQVRDNGPGLPETEQRVLQAGDETPLQHGSGLGL